MSEDKTKDVKKEDKNKVTVPNQGSKPAFKYYKSAVAGLSIQLSEAQDEHPERPNEVRFQPYYERYQGDRVRVGYLKADASNKRLIKLLDADLNVQEISVKAYKKATEGEESEKAPY